MHVDLHFPVLGNALPADHGYELYAALSRLVPELHAPDCLLLQVKNTLRKTLSQRRLASLRLEASLAFLSYKPMLNARRQLKKISLFFHFFPSQKAYINMR